MNEKYAAQNPFCRCTHEATTTMKTIIIYYCDYCVKSQTYLLLFAFYGFAYVPFCACSKNQKTVRTIPRRTIQCISWICAFYLFFRLFFHKIRRFQFDESHFHVQHEMSSLFSILCKSLLISDRRQTKTQHIRVRIRILKLCNARNRGIAHCSHSKIEQHRKEKQKNTQKNMP